jgi:hypothetical protein
MSMKKNVIVISVFTTLVASSCKKEKDLEPVVSETTAPSANPNMYHFPLTIGSYWIYEDITVDSNNVIISHRGLDSVFVEKDTIINGKQYFKKKIVALNPTGYYVGWFFENNLISRDSSGYIVNPTGKFIKHDDFTHILDIFNYNESGAAFTTTNRMAHKDSLVTVPAGTFPTINYLAKITIPDSINAKFHITYCDHILANNIGLIYKTISFYSSMTALDNRKSGIRLIRYHIAP